jgi:nucleotide-binding universal stress UspA family protein
MFDRIIVPTDFSACSEEAWSLARGVAAMSRGEGLSARAALRTGVAYAEIVATATDERADLIVIGTHGRGTFERALLGSVADRVVRLAPCPVLTVREPA